MKALAFQNMKRVATGAILPHEKLFYPIIEESKECQDDNNISVIFKEKEDSKSNLVIS